MTDDEVLSRLIYRDALMLVINKPAGLPVHPGPKGGITLTDYLDVLRFGLPKRPQAAHRLDKETSGCLILGRHAKALTQLNDLFQRNAVDKTYWAVVQGGPEADEGEIDFPLALRSPHRGWWMKVDATGQPSLTRWRVLGRSLKLAVLALTPVTGRTHQLRIHCAESGWPIIGDPIYGDAPRFGGPGLHLHARELSIPLYRNKPPVKVEARLPEHMFDRLQACGIAP